MAKQLQLRRGTTAQHSTFTGALGEVTVDTDKDTLVVHDATTVGGFSMSRESALTAHISDTADAHAASAVTNTPAGTIAATTVQAAINELDSEKVAKTVVVTTAITSVTFNVDGTMTIVTP
jgi:hypothetical protein